MDSELLPIAFVCQVMSACRSTNQLLSVCLYKISLTPTACQLVCRGGVGCVWGGGDFGNQAEQEHTTAACWNNRAAEMTAPHGSYYPPGLLIGQLGCPEKRLVWNTVA